MTDAQRLIKLTAKLYDAKTPANKRADLSLGDFVPEEEGLRGEGRTWRR